jgi:cytochrome c biogenesis factor
MNDIGAYALRCACVVALYAVSMAILGVRATLQVSRHRRRITALYPEKRLYFAQNQLTAEVALCTSLFDDLYVILAGSNLQEWQPIKCLSILWSFSYGSVGSSWL